MFDHYLALAQPWLDHYGYWALFVTVFVEGFGVPAPGQTFMIGGALLAQRGEMHIGSIAAIAWAAAALGDNVGYVIGRLGGHRFLRRLHFAEKGLHSVEARFRKYGGLAVMFARFFEVLRQLNGVVAGSLEMPWLRFLIFNATGAVFWVLVWVFGVYYLDARIAALLRGFDRIHFWVALFGGAIAAATAAWLIWRWRRYNRRTHNITK